jgi:hypothetical protein
MVIASLTSEMLGKAACVVDFTNSINKAVLYLRNNDACHVSEEVNSLA